MTTSNAQTTREKTEKFTVSTPEKHFRFMEQQRDKEGRTRSNYIQSLLKAEQDRIRRRK